jgi:hypothetical protein
VDEPTSVVDEPTVTETRALSYDDPSRTWHQVTGLLVDIATGNGASSRWGIDTNFARGGGNVVKWVGSKWQTTAGRGLRIALLGGPDNDQDGFSDTYLPWVINDQGRLYRATDTSGNTWVQVPDIAPGITFRDIGGGGGSATAPRRMWAAGSDGFAYLYLSESAGWMRVGSNSPTGVVIVSAGPHCRPNNNDVMALTSLGEVWYSGNDGWWRMGSYANPRRTDISAGFPVNGSVGGFLNSVMAVGRSESGSEGVTAWMTWTPAFQPLHSPAGVPIAVASDCERSRVWVVMDNHTVWYGE